MIYPNQVITNNGWYPIPYTSSIIFALRAGDSAYVATNTNGATLRLALPQEARDCQLRVSGNGYYLTPELSITFWSGGNPTGFYLIQLQPDWQAIELDVPYWEEVEIVATTNYYAHIDYLFGLAFGELPTRRLLAGVGV